MLHLGWAAGALYAVDGVLLYVPENAVAQRRANLDASYDVWLQRFIAAIGKLNEVLEPRNLQLLFKQKTSTSQGQGKVYDQYDATQSLNFSTTTSTTDQWIVFRAIPRAVPVSVSQPAIVPVNVSAPPAVSMQEVRNVFCPSCGVAGVPPYKFCKGCGQSLA